MCELSERSTSLPTPYQLTSSRQKRLRPNDGWALRKAIMLLKKRKTYGHWPVVPYDRGSCAPSLLAITRTSAPRVGARYRLGILWNRACGDLCFGRGDTLRSRSIHMGPRRPLDEGAKASATLCAVIFYRGQYWSTISTEAGSTFRAPNERAVTASPVPHSASTAFSTWLASAS